MHCVLGPGQAYAGSVSTETIILVAAGAVFLVAVVSGRLKRIWLTEPFLAMALGVGAGLLLLDGPLDLEQPAVLTLLELTLALVLFSDASRIDIARLEEGYSWPLRMLVIAIPVVIAIGAGFAAWYLALPLGLSLLVGVLLAPTDAALAEPVLDAEDVPVRVRQTLNIESGLNDGLVVPVLLLAIGVIEAEGAGTAADAVKLVVSQLGIGIVGGLFLGWLGAKLIGAGTERGWMNELHQRMSAVALALAGFAAVQLLGGSGFVAVFIAGGLMSHLIRPRCEYLYDFAEEEGQSLVLLAFFAVGAGPVTMLLQDGVEPGAVVVALVSLVALRPLAVALSLVGQRLNVRTVVFLGWFGPRGLATVVFALMAAEELGSIPTIVVDIVTVVVALSIVAHGVSGVPMSNWLAGATSRMPTDMPEMGEAYPHPMKRR